MLKHRLEHDDRRYYELRSSAKLGDALLGKIKIKRVVVQESMTTLTFQDIIKLTWNMKKRSFLILKLYTKHTLHHSNKQLWNAIAVL